MAYENIIYEKKGNIAYMTLNRPEALNATNRAMHDEMYDAWKDVIKDDDIRVVVLTGAGRGFQSGADMKEAASGKRTRGHSGFPGMAEGLNKPIVCAVNGICGGGGLNLMNGCDIIIASEKAEFFDPHVSVGWSSIHVTFGMASRMPYGEAMRMSLMGVSYRMSAQRAYELGLVTEVVPHDKLMERATEIAKAIAEQAPLAVMDIKEIMKKAYMDVPFAAALDMAGKRPNARGVSGSNDHKEGPIAFAQKRKPQWTGK